MVRDFLREIPKVLDDMERLVEPQTRIFLSTAPKGSGVLDKEERLTRSATGPIAPAACSRPPQDEPPYWPIGIWTSRCLRRGRGLLRTRSTWSRMAENAQREESS